jgi:hypothetical protein
MWAGGSVWCADQEAHGATDAKMQQGANQSIRPMHSLLAYSPPAGFSECTLRRGGGQHRLCDMWVLMLQQVRRLLHHGTTLQTSDKTNLRNVKYGRLCRCPEFSLCVNSRPGGHGAAWFSILYRFVEGRFFLPAPHPEPVTLPLCRNTDSSPLLIRPGASFPTGLGMLFRVNGTKFGNRADSGVFRPPESMLSAVGNERRRNRNPALQSHNGFLIYGSTSASRKDAGGSYR